jgi:nucleotide-binding universal stress UspA family protein
MTVLVGYVAGKDSGSALHLGVETAKSLNTSLTVATVIPRPLLTLSSIPIHDEYTQFATQLGNDSARQAQLRIEALDPNLGVSYRQYPHRSAAGALLEAIDELNAEVLVLGSAADGRPGQVAVGSTADRLLHSSPIPVAISPRGYRGSKSHQLTAITCAYPGTPESIGVVGRVADLARRLEVPLRVITFAVRGQTMYPPQIGLHPEDAILQVRAAQAQEALAKLKADAVIDHDVAVQVIAGHSWQQALDSAEWLDGKLLALGTSPRETIARVFLGARASKIVRHSPIPALVLPHE